MVERVDGKSGRSGIAICLFVSSEQSKYKELSQIASGDDRSEIIDFTGNRSFGEPQVSLSLSPWSDSC